MTGSLQTFFVDLDLTSYHGPIRPPRRRSEASVTTPATASSQLPSSPVHHSTPETGVAQIAPDPDSDRDHVQILGLHTLNPIVSYQNRLFSCSWTDLIGTELLFTHPQAEAYAESTLPEMPSLKRGKNYDLIAANSVKIIGRRANAISRSGSGLALDPVAEPGNPPGSSGPSAPQTNQARFLQRLANVKRSKGEMDTVRTVFSVRRAQNIDDRLRGWARTEEQMAEIQHLNHRALQGDDDALVRLESLFAQLAPQDRQSDTAGTPVLSEHQYQ